MQRLIILVFLLPAHFCRANDSLLFDSLKYVNPVPHCLAPAHEQPDSNSIFWRIVKLKETAIQPLIDKIDDSTTTSAMVHHFGGYYTVGDVAFYALSHIIKDIPTFELLGVKFDENGCGYCSYWNHLREDQKNRQKFRVKLQRWYAENKPYLVWSWHLWKAEECFYENPNKGYYEVKK
jgi:hypothetical protein